MLINLTNQSLSIDNALRQNEVDRNEVNHLQNQRQQEQDDFPVVSTCSEEKSDASQKGSDKNRDQHEIGCERWRPFQRDRNIDVVPQFVFEIQISQLSSGVCNFPVCDRRPLAVRDDDGHRRRSDRIQVPFELVRAIRPRADVDAAGVGVPGKVFVVELTVRFQTERRIHDDFPVAVDLRQNVRSGDGGRR